MKISQGTYIDGAHSAQHAHMWNMNSNWNVQQCIVPQYKGCVVFDVFIDKLCYLSTILTNSVYQQMAHIQINAELHPQHHMEINGDEGTHALCWLNNENYLHIFMFDIDVYIYV